MQEFGVKAVAQSTGINAHTLRVWERRFKIVTPTRTAAGRRVYSKGDVDKLRLIAVLVSQGHAISQIAKLSPAELEEAVATGRADAIRKTGVSLPRGDTPDARVNEMLLDRIVVALEAFRLRDVSAQLAVARMQTSATEFVFAIVSPLLRRIGLLVEGDQLSIAHEHAISAILKTHIYQSLYSVSGANGADASVESDRPSLTIATQEGDFHEFGILLAALLGLSRHFPVHFLGCNMPARSLAFAVNALRSPIVLVGKTLPGTTSSQGVEITQKQYLKELDASLLPNTEIWIGGHADPGCTKFKSRHPLTVLPTLEALDRRLADLGKMRDT